MNIFQKRLTHCLTRDSQYEDQNQNDLNLHDSLSIKKKQERAKQKSNRFAKRLHSQPSVEPIVNIDFRLKTYYKPNKQYKFTGSCFKNDFGRKTKTIINTQNSQYKTKQNFHFREPAPTLQSKYIIDVKTDLMKNNGKKKMFTRKNRIKTIPNLINLEDYLTEKKTEFKRQIECQVIRMGQAHLLPLIQEKQGKIYIKALHKVYERKLKIASKRQGLIYFHIDGKKEQNKKSSKKKKIKISKTMNNSKKLINLQLQDHQLNKTIQHRSKKSEYEQEYIHIQEN